MQTMVFLRAKAIVGATLLGLGAFVSYHHLSHVVTQLSLLCATPCEVHGATPRAILAAWRIWQASPADQKRFLQVFLRHMLISSWPLLLVTVGRVMSGEIFSEDNVNLSSQKK